MKHHIQKNNADLLIEGGTVITMDEERRVFCPGFVAVTDGIITQVGGGAPSGYSANERIDAREMVVLPGIVNAHDHLDQSLYRGCSDEEQERVESRASWLSRARNLTRERAFSGAALTLLELVRYGVTTTQENHWTHFHPDSTDGICEAIQQSGMRAIVSRGMNDNPEYTPMEFCEQVNDVLDDLDRLEREYESDRISITAEPCTILRCHPDTILAMREWSLKRDKMWHIHLAQNREELAEALRTKGMGSVQYAESLGVLGPEMYAIHCSGLRDQEIELLGEYQVRIGHCPLPIMRGGGRVPPIWELEKLGAVVALGTDGVASNNGQNPWEAMKMAVYMQRVSFGERYLGTAEQALELATIKAAQALGMDHRVGSLEPGKEADIAMVPCNQPHLAPGAMLVNNLVYSGLDNRADTVVVGGKLILRDGKSCVFDEEKVIARAREAQKAILKEAGLEGEMRQTASWPVIYQS